MASQSKTRLHEFGAQHGPVQSEQYGLCRAQRVKTLSRFTDSHGQGSAYVIVPSRRHHGTVRKTRLRLRLLVNHSKFGSGRSQLRHQGGGKIRQREQTL